MDVKDFLINDCSLALLNGMEDLVVKCDNLYLSLMALDTFCNKCSQIYIREDAKWMV